jgi:hypothetical protein
MAHNFPGAFQVNRDLKSPVGKAREPQSPRRQRMCYRADRRRKPARFWACPDLWILRARVCADMLGAPMAHPHRAANPMALSLTHRGLLLCRVAGSHRLENSDQACEFYSVENPQNRRLSRGRLAVLGPNRWLHICSAFSHSGAGPSHRCHRQAHLAPSCVSTRAYLPSPTD